MKKFITYVIVLLFTITTYAQSNSINYKALIKDANNAVLANTQVTVQFSILEGTTNVYQETHTPTTDANGIVIINIGEGTVDSGVFDDINWASDDHFLNTQINTGSGLVDMGTTGFKTVPYALSAKTAENVTGLEAISVTEPVGFPTGGTGLVKKDRNSSNYGTVGYEAIDLSFSNTADNTLGATGPGSLATGFETTASGGASTALGNSTVASGEDSSTAIGSRTTASGDNATAMGYETVASGFSSTTMGRNTTAESYGQTTLGLYNVPTTANDAENFNALDHILVVGNGEDDSNTSDALIILKNGTITAPSFDISEITDDKALVTKEYAEANLAGSGLETIDEGNGNGLVKVGRDPVNYGNVGLNAVDLSYSDTSSSTIGATGSYSTAMGQSTVASGFYATAMGNITTASGESSTAMGQFSEASGFYATAMGNITTASGVSSTAMGRSTTASGDNSTAMGRSTTASGDNSTAMGVNSIASEYASTSIGEATNASGLFSVAMGLQTTASGFSSTAMGLSTLSNAYANTAIGQYNIGGGNPTTIVSTDPLFEIGNGSPGNRSNAMTVLNNGNVGIGIANPNTTLNVAGDITMTSSGLGDATLTVSSYTADAPIRNSILYLEANGGPGNGFGAQGRINVKHDTGGTSGASRMDFSVRESSGVNANRLTIRHNGFVGINTTSPSATLSVNGSANKSGGGSWAVFSDRRLKKDIKPYQDGLKSVLAINPVKFKYNGISEANTTTEYVGVIAQELEKISPYMINTIEIKDTEYLEVDNSAMTYMLINAIKELNAKVEELKLKNLEQAEALDANTAIMKELKALLTTEAKQ